MLRKVIFQKTLFYSAFQFDKTGKTNSSKKEGAQYVYIAIRFRGKRVGEDGILYSKGLGRGGKRFKSQCLLPRSGAGYPCHAEKDCNA